MSQDNPVRELRVVLTVDDLEAALALYRDALGLPVAETFPGGTVLAAGRATLEVLTRAEADRVDRIEAGRTSNSVLRLGMRVADSAATGKALAAAGMTRVADPVATPWGHTNQRMSTAEGVQLTLFSEPPADPA